jgi:stage V sporulation protein S
MMRVAVVVVLALVLSAILRCLSSSKSPIVHETLNGGMNMVVVKVGAKSNASKVAGSIAGYLRDKEEVEIHCIGAGSINQGVKAIAITRGFMAPMGIDLICIPAFMDIVIDGENRTAIKFIVEAR